jgi:hypothetical protein
LPCEQSQPIAQFAKGRNGQSDPKTRIQRGQNVGHRRTRRRRRQLGADGVNGVVTKGEQYCAHEERRIALENHAPIVALRAELSLLVDEERRLKDLLRNAPPPGDLRHLRRKKIFYWAVAVILTVTGFCLAVYTFAPFRLGWPGYLFCTGIATVVPFLVEKLLEDRRFEVVVKVLTTIAAVAGVASLMLLADVRGHLLAREIESQPAVVIDDAQPAEQAPPDDFYGATLGSLRLATVLLSPSRWSWVRGWPSVKPGPRRPTIPRTGKGSEGNLR